MAGIVIVGLGPGGRGQVTEEARELLTVALAERRVVLRTRVHPTVDAWPALRQASSLDHHYEAADAFDAVYERIAGEVMERAAALPPETELVYAVPGNPAVGEAT